MTEINTAAETAAPHRDTAAMAADIEARWQDFWDAEGTYEAPNPTGDLAGDPAIAARPKKFIMDLFPYPSGAGLHVGHPLGYIATDVFARHARMTGHNVLHTLGFDAFGLPAEQYAVQTGTHPRVSTEANIVNMKAQLRRLGLGHDRRRSFATIDPGYYKWTQWVFLQLLKQGLAYKKQAAVNWCPSCKTVLANEQVIGGACERCDTPVEQRFLSQWFFRISDYASRLLANLDKLDWSETTKTAQRNWIGRSNGADVAFSIEGRDEPVSVYTTRPDTLYGVTFMVVAPDSELAAELVDIRTRAG